MSSNVISLPLNDGKFSVDIVFRDAIRQNPPATYSIDCTVDTGYTGGIALPEGYNEKLIRYQGEELVVTPHGSERAETYAIHVLKLDDIEIAPFVITATCSMKSRDHGLIGVEFLKYIDSAIHSEPENKSMDVFFTYVELAD